MRFVQRQQRRFREPDAEWEQPWPVPCLGVPADLEEDDEEPAGEAAL